MMRRSKSSLRFGSPVLTAVLFVLAGILLLGSSIGGARAALTYFSETYKSQIEMYDIGVTLMENGVDISNRDYVANSDDVWDEAQGVLLSEKDESYWGKIDTIEPGVAYTEIIAAKNTGSIAEYVRITLYTYWEDASGKRRDLDPGLIVLHTVNENYWLLDEKASTRERKVYYYNRILGTEEEEGEGGNITPPLTDTLTINGSLLGMFDQVESDNRITTSYKYDGLTFTIEATVDAVQTHNAEDAIWSAWGRRVKIDNGRLRLVD